ncbi:D-2-hydroxyacid dehydrogenase family protein [Muricoccus aerilatus]|uniref:D-2-hydroxyacid dehydrogenase family protein n=1 Tax=Muricoccus aerilatus TaxID=452982 RepID=UPI000A701681|nr:D-2-hydroxyacid dehydrogenase family protein [Roseomonas aerilata]
MTGRIRVAIINDHAGLAREAADWSSLPDGVEVQVHAGRIDDPAATLAGNAVVVTAREETRFDAALLDRLPDLRLLVTHGMNNAALDLAALRAHGVTVCGTTLGDPSATVELAWALILGLARHVPAEDRAIRAGGWGAGLGRSLSGQRLGVLGLGTLGAGVARVGLAFGMEVAAWSENLTAARCAEVGVHHVTRNALFAESDVLSIHLRFSPRSRGLVGAAEIGRMPPEALLINTARGPIVDEAALIAALRTGTIGGAGLDVFEAEPLPLDHPLRGMPNVLLTSHVGGRTRENLLARYRDAFEDVRAWLAGAPVRVITG